MMMLKKKIKVLILLLLFTAGLKAQIKHYQFKRELKGISTNWHSLQVPNQVFKSAQTGLEDLRIYGIKGKDTIEVPYILEQSSNQITDRETTFNIINQSNNQNGYYYTFQSATIASINQIKLSFKQTNFDWKIQLQGSNDNQEWFGILDDYRILSIKNNNTDYQFTQLNFPTARFTFFRVLIKASEKPELNAAKISKTDTLKGIDLAIPYKSYKMVNEAKNKQSIIDVGLANITPISYIKINAQNDFDFYRSIRIESAIDSVKTEKGIQYNYTQLYEGTLSSLESPEFRFNSTLATHLRITIENNDNKPLRLNSIVLKGPIYELIARFEQTDYQYALYYGNATATIPSYELKNFENKIPLGITTLTINEEQKNEAFTTKTEQKPLFENKVWLWSLMALIIALLGYFAYKMLKN